jgi:hypothetical protein
MKKAGFYNAPEIVHTTSPAHSAGGIVLITPKLKARKKREGWCMPPERCLVFVYNADSRVLPRMNDHTGRVAAPGKDSCSLYAVTFSPIGMKKEWKRFVHDLGIPVRFLSRDEFISEFRIGSATFPAAFLQTGKDLFLFISTDEINRCPQLEDLISLVQQRLPQFREKPV